MKIGVNNLCPCQSSKKYKKCCKIFHEGALPKTAQELMRSRYSAFATNNAEYIMKTTHPSNSDFSENKSAWQSSILEFTHHTQFVGLDILNHDEKEQEAFVTFHAKLFQGDEECSFTEKSLFFKVDGQWLYHSGSFLDE